MSTEFAVALVSAVGAIVVAGIKRGWSLDLGPKEKDFLAVVAFLGGAVYVLVALVAGLPHRLTFVNGNIRTEYGSPLSPPYRWTQQWVRSFDLAWDRAFFDLFVVFAGTFVFLLLFGQDPGKPAPVEASPEQAR